MPEFNLPGLGYLRTAVRYATRRAPGPATLRRDGLAGLTVTVSSVPGGMANGLLAGVNPIFGLYANMVGPVIGAALSSSRLMVINSTSAAAIVAGQALVGQDASALFLMVMMAGVIAILLGVLRLGWLTNFVSFSVMTGFIAGIAGLLIISQLPTVSGFSPDAEGAMPRALELLGNLNEVHLPSLAMAGIAIVIMLGLRSTRLNTMASLLAVAVPTVIVLIFSLDDVAMVRDVGEISGGVPMPRLPTLDDLSLEVVTGAFSVALIVLIQGAGVSQTVPDSNASGNNASRDFIAQGVANVGAGAIGGLPVGGSLGGTALNIISGGRRRWAGVFAGLSMAVIVIAIPSVVSAVVMPALGALLIVTGTRIVKPSEITAVWRAGWPPRLAALTTFAAVLLAPVQIAVGIGVALSVVLFANAAMSDVSVVKQVELPDGRIEERSAPKQLPNQEVTVLDAYGDLLFFAGARKLGELLPDPRSANRPVVILRLRGRSRLGATLAEVLSRYADAVNASDGRLYLTGLSADAHEHLLRSGTFHSCGPAQVYEATPIVGESTKAAYEDATAWLSSRADDESEQATG